MSVFNIFGEHADVVLPKAKNISRLGVGNENLGKLATSHQFNGPIKPNEPLKKADPSRKTFLMNKGKALQSTPVKPGTPFGKANLNVQPIKIYSDYDDGEKGCDIQEQLEFHKPLNQYDNITKDIFDDIPQFSYGMELLDSPRSLTPKPKVLADRNMEMMSSFEDDFLKGDLSNDSITMDLLDLPSFEF